MEAQTTSLGKSVYQDVTVTKRPLYMQTPEDLKWKKPRPSAEARRRLDPEVKAKFERDQSFDVDDPDDLMVNYGFPEMSGNFLSLPERRDIGTLTEALDLIDASTSTDETSTACFGTATEGTESKDISAATDEFETVSTGTNVSVAHITTVEATMQTSVYIPDPLPSSETLDNVNLGISDCHSIHHVAAQTSVLQQPLVDATSDCIGLFTPLFDVAMQTVIALPVADASVQTLSEVSKADAFMQTSVECSEDDVSVHTLISVSKADVAVQTLIATFLPEAAPYSPSKDIDFRVNEVLSEEIADLAGSLTSVQRENAVLTKRLRELEALRKDIEIRRNEAVVLVADRNRSLQSAQEQLEETLSKYTPLELANKELVDKVRILSEHYRIAQTLLETQATSLGDAQAENLELREMRQLDEAKMVDLEMVAVEAVTELDDARQKIKLLTRTCRAKDEQMEDLVEELDMYKNKYGTLPPSDLISENLIQFGSPIPTGKVYADTATSPMAAMMSDAKIFSDVPLEEAIPERSCATHETQTSPSVAREKSPKSPRKQKKRTSTESNFSQSEVKRICFADENIGYGRRELYTDPGRLEQSTLPNERSAGFRLRHPNIPFSVHKASTMYEGKDLNSQEAVTASNNARPNSPDISGQKKKATSMETLLPPREALQRTLEMRQLLRQQGLLSRGYGSEILTSANVRHATGQEMPFSSDLKIGRPSQTLGPSGWNLLVSTQNIAQSTQGSTDGKRGNVPVMKGSLRPPFTGQYASGVVKK